MPPDTAERPAEPVVEIPDETRVAFHSTFEHHLLTRVPDTHIVTALGQKVPKPGVHYTFVGGLLTLRVGQDVLADRMNEQTGELEEQDAVDWIRAHPLFGVNITEIPPVPPAPDAALQKVMQAAVARDERTLVDIYEQEGKGFQRAAVLRAVENALRAIESTAELPPVRPEDAAHGVGQPLEPVRDPDAPPSDEEEEGEHPTVAGAPPRPSRGAAAAGFMPEAAPEFEGLPEAPESMR